MSEEIDLYFLKILLDQWIKISYEWVRLYISLFSVELKTVFN